MTDSFPEEEIDISEWVNSSFLQLVANKLNISPIQIKLYSIDFKFIRIIKVDRIKFLYKYPLFFQTILLFHLQQRVSKQNNLFATFN